MTAEAAPGNFVWLLGLVMGGYVALMFAVGWLAQRRVHDVEDFLVAGRRLPLGLAWPTLLATWFGAGTLLAVTDEVRAQGLQAAALDPFGAGTCLLLAGLFFARPLWSMKLLTVPDFFRRRFGPRAELLAAWLLVPSYFGWIAAQFVAVAGMLELFFGLDPAVGLLVAAIVGTGYTLMGGMWAVTLTDALQIGLVIVGLGVLGHAVLQALGAGDSAAGLQRLLAETPPDKLRLLPGDGLAALTGWLGVFAVGALGNLPGQDLMQRVFASRSAQVARRACFVAGGLYLTLGLVPLGLGLAGDILLPEDANRSILPLLAHLFLSPWLAVVLIVVVLSAVLSTIDSALLSPSSVLAQNVFGRRAGSEQTALARNRWAVLAVALCSLGVAFLGESAYSLLESAYELTLVSLFVPLAMGLWRGGAPERAALGAMATGTALWGLHALFGWDAFLAPFGAALPVALSSALCGLGVYLALGRRAVPAE